MAFNSKYVPSYEGSLSSCILDFFGFEHSKEYSSYSQGVYVSDSNEISGQRKEYRSHITEREIFVRKTTPTGKALELENKFIKLIENDPKWQYRGPFGKTFDPCRTMNKPTSLAEYYKLHCFRSVNKNITRPSSRIFFIIAAIICGIWFLPYSYIFPVFEAKFGYDIGSVLYVFPVPGIAFLSAIIIKSIRQSRYEKKLLRAKASFPEFSKLNSVKKAEIRQKYLDDMDSFYGKEAGDFLREYAKLKGYDK